MYKKVFLDANVLIDIYDTHRPFSVYSQKAVRHLLADESIDIFTSCDIITTVYYLRSKTDKVQALEDIIQLNQLCHIIEFGNTEVTKSCRLMKQNSKFKDLEDTIQYVMAKKVDADLILSNDGAFVSDGIPLMSTEMFCKENGL